MKQLVKKILQTLLGFDNYLFFFSLYIIFTLKWNHKERDFLHFLGMLPNNGTVLDIGANIGIMTVHLARHLPQANVLAFEPIPSNIKALRRIIHYFNLNNVAVMDFALGNSEGEAQMVMPVLGNTPMQGLSHVIHESIPDLNEGRKYQIKIKRLDSIAPLFDKGLILSAIKIDVENFEYFVLAGAENLIRLHRPIIYAELWENENRSKCFSLLKSLDYNVMVLNRGKLEPYSIENHKTQNFFFISSSPQIN
ncbi:MAG: FkbM family methyltransferase [Bacteroidales bacterium]